MLPLLTLSFGGAMIIDQPEADAWPVVSYDQFDGTYETTECSNPSGSLNIIVGHAEGDPLDPLGLGENEDGTDKLPLKVVGIPLIHPIAMACKDGRPEVDLEEVGSWLVNRCEASPFNIMVGDEGQDLCEFLALEFPQSVPLSPAVEEIDFDWRPNGFTWLFGNNVSNTVYTFEDGSEAVNFQNLFRSNVHVPVLSKNGEPVLKANGTPKMKWIPNNERAVFTNLIDKGGYSAEISGELPIGDTLLPWTCARTMLMHSHGVIDVSGEEGLVTAEVDTLPMLNCAIEIADDEYLGLHVSLATKYQLEARPKPPAEEMGAVVDPAASDLTKNLTGRELTADEMPAFLAQLDETEGSECTDLAGDDDEDQGPEPQTGSCSVNSKSTPTLGGLALLALFGLRRRRRR